MFKCHYLTSFYLTIMKINKFEEFNKMKTDLLQKITDREKEILTII